MSDPFGWARRDGCPGLTEAVRALRERANRPPDERDLPPPSTFPATPASRAALALSSLDGPPLVKHRIVRRNGELTRERRK